MNIHFNNRYLFNQLKSLAILKVEVGSPLYGLKNENSDVDYLYLYLENEENLHSFQWTHHQLQYNIEGEDHVFTTVKNFIRSILTGDSTLNFELLFSEEFKKRIDHSNETFLTEYKSDFISYNIIKAYLGFAKRDFKNIGKAPYYNLKTLSHFIRGVSFAERCLKGEFYLEAPPICKKIKEGNVGEEELKNLIQHYETLMKELRTELNRRLESGMIHRSMKVETLRELDKKLVEYSKINHRGVKIDYGDLYYEVISEGDVRY